MQQLQVVTVELTQSQLFNLSTSPVQILPAQGPGKIIIPIASLAELEFGTTAYTAGDQINLVYAGQGFGTNPTVAIANTNLTRSSSSAFSWIGVNGSSFGNFSNSIGKNVGMNLVTDSNFASGDGKLLVTVWYVVTTLL